jgi:hypothetical protein
MAFGTRGVAVRPLLVSSYDAEINAKLVGQARFRNESHPFWITTRDAQFFHTVLLYLYSDLPRDFTHVGVTVKTAHGNAKRLHEAGSSFGCSR